MGVSIEGLMGGLLAHCSQQSNSSALGRTEQTITGGPSFRRCQDGLLRKEKAGQKTIYETTILLHEVL